MITNALEKSSTLCFLYGEGRSTQLKKKAWRENFWNTINVYLLICVAATWASSLYGVHKVFIYDLFTFSKKCYFKMSEKKRKKPKKIKITRKQRQKFVLLFSFKWYQFLPC